MYDLVILEKGPDEADHHGATRAARCPDNGDACKPGRRVVEDVGESLVAGDDALAFTQRPIGNDGIMRASEPDIPDVDGFVSADAKHDGHIAREAGVDEKPRHGGYADIG